MKRMFAVLLLMLVISGCDNTERLPIRTGQVLVYCDFNYNKGWFNIQMNPYVLEFMSDDEFNTTCLENKAAILGTQEE